jgi:phage terminase small subunit
MAQRKKSSKGTKLTHLQELFCQYYAVSGNGAESVRMAGYKAQKAPFDAVQASTLLDNPLIKARIEEIRKPLFKKLEITKERTMQEIARLAFSDIGRIFDGDGNIKPVSEIDEDTRRAISGIDVDELTAGSGSEKTSIGVNKKVKLYDKVKSLEMLAKHFGIYTDAPQTKTVVKVGYGKEEDE